MVKIPPPTSAAKGTTSTAKGTTSADCSRRLLADGILNRERPGHRVGGQRELCRSRGGVWRPRQVSAYTRRLAGVEGLEPPTPGFGDRCSSQLSYTPKRAASLMHDRDLQCKPAR